MIKINGTWKFQNEFFSKKSNMSKLMNSEYEKELHKLFISDLKEMYWSEKIMVKALGKIIKNTTDLYLILLLNLNLEITKNQILRLEHVFRSVKLKLEIKSCEHLKILLHETNSYIKHYVKGSFKDEIMMLNYQKTVQIEIETYNSLLEYVNLTGETGAAFFLKESLNEKIKLDLKLSEIHELNVNSNIQEYF